MASDTTYTPDTAQRLEAIEEALDTIWSMLKNLMNKEQFNRLNVLVQKEHDLLDDRITELETQLTTLQTEINNLL